jgi:hypothetical protein
VGDGHAEEAAEVDEKYEGVAAAVLRRARRTGDSCARLLENAASISEASSIERSCDEECG